MMLFTDEEKTNCQSSLVDALDTNNSFLMVDVSNLSKKPEMVELFCCTYLITNAVFMDLLKKRIFKGVFLRGDDFDDIAPILNQLRFLFHSDFASLENIDTWKKIVSNELKLTEVMLDRIKSAISFVKGAGMSSGMDFFRHAQVHFGFQDSGDEPRTEDSPFLIDHAEGFRKIISAGDVSRTILAPEVFSRGEGLRVNLSKSQPFILMEVDMEQPDCLDHWLSNIDVICSTNFYGSDAE